MLYIKKFIANINTLGSTVKQIRVSQNCTLGPANERGYTFYESQYSEEAELNTLASSSQYKSTLFDKGK